jgi:hypothetical protein
LNKISAFVRYRELGGNYFFYSLLRRVFETNIRLFQGSFRLRYSYRLLIRRKLFFGDFASCILSLFTAIADTLICDDFLNGYDRIGRLLQGINVGRH